MNHRLFGRLLISVWLVYLAHFRHLAAGSDRFVLLTMALVEQGTVQLDAYYHSEFYANYLGDVILYNSHAYSNINPALSFFAVPAWAIFYLFYRQLPPSSILREEAIHYFLAHFISFAFTTAFFGALTVWVLAILVRHKTQQEWRGMVAGLLYGLGSIAFFFSTRLNQNIPVVLICILVFILTFKDEFLLKFNSSIRWGFLGFLLGMGTILDLTAVPFLGIVFLFLIWQQRKTLRNLIYVILGAIFPIAGQFIYNYWAFGDPRLSPSLVLAQLNTNSETINPLKLGLQSFNFQSLAQYLFSPSAGLFIYMPYSFLAVWYLIRHWREQNRLTRTEKLAIASIFVSYCIFISILPIPYLHSLFGPRYLFPVIPLMVLVFVLYWGCNEFQLGMVLAAIALLFNIAGAQLGNDTGNIIVTAAVYILRGPWLPIIDWLRSELPKATGSSIEFLSPYGLLILLVACLLLLWIPYCFDKLNFKKEEIPQEK